MSYTLISASRLLPPSFIKCKGPHKVVDEGSGRFRIEFTTVEVGSYVIDVNVNGLTVPNSPLIAKAYDAGLIKVSVTKSSVARPFGNNISTQLIFSTLSLYLYP